MHGGTRQRISTRKGPRLEGLLIQTYVHKLRIGLLKTHVLVLGGKVLIKAHAILLGTVVRYPVISLDHSFRNDTSISFRVSAARKTATCAATSFWKS